MGRFAKVDNQAVDFVGLEREVLEFWERERVFEQLRALRDGGPRWSFLDGPITANGPMGVHHAWGRTYKDVQQRYRAMRGFDQRWQNGFDCQGLWVEVEVEKDLGFESKRDIEAFGLETFIRACKQRVLRFAARQTEQSIRLGQWMRWDDPETLRFLERQLDEDPSRVVTIRGALGDVTDTVEGLVGRLGSPDLGGSYFTFSDENNYCIWAFLKRCHERGLIYRGRDVIPWCWRCGTAISDHEMETEGYQERTHQSLFVKLPLTGVGRSAVGVEGTTGIQGSGFRVQDGESEPKSETPSGHPNPKSERRTPSADRPTPSLLVWTTTPWTLTSNVAVAVGPEIEYVRVRQGEDVLYVAKEALPRAIRGDYQVLEELRGADMVGWTYVGPYDELEAVREAGVPAAHRVIPWEVVGAEEGTGMVHIAPGCGAEDFRLGQQFDLPAVAPIDESGHYLPGFGPYTGQHVTEVDTPIARDLREKGLLYRSESYRHRYPTCWRCKRDLVFRLVDEWFISMGPVYDKPYQEVTPGEKAASLRYQIMDVVTQIRWIPSFGLERELDWLRNMQDWMISKKRFWGLALPIWECDGCQRFDVVGSREELRARAVAGWDEFDGHTPHRPYVDAVELRCDACGGAMRRVRDVGNPWLDAGIVSFSTLEYRHDPAYWERWFPADFITESFPGQFRNWFYSLLTMSTVLENRPPFLTALGFATLMGEDGRPMHKTAGNMIDFDTGANEIGVDVMRWMYVSQRPEANLPFGYGTANEARRQFLIPLWNCYAFFANYAALDGWAPGQGGGTPSTLDRWLLSRLQQLVAACTAALDDYDHVACARELQQFVDEDLSKWYVRRSRPRVWKGGDADDDKLATYTTLYEALVTVAKLVAPSLPFVAETMYQNLVRRVDPSAPPSIHLCDWPAAAPARVDEGVLEAMGLALDLVRAGHAARAGAKLKVRQPLARASAFVPADRRLRALPTELVEVVQEELNVKDVRFVEDVSALATYRVLPNNQLLGPKYGKRFPQLRQALLALDPAGVARRVQVGEPIELVVEGDHLCLQPEEILVQSDPRPGLAVGSEHGVTVGLDTELTPELLREGIARDVVRQIQDLRKRTGFEIEDRIHLRYAASGEVARAIEEHREYIARETLAVSLEPGEVEGEGAVTSFEIHGEKVAIRIWKAG